MAKIKKAQMGKGVPKNKAVTESGKMVDRKAFMKRQDDMVKSMNDQYFSRPENKKAVAPKKKTMKNGGKASFPDLNKDGKVTKADILKGRGVIKNGGKMAKKAMSGMKMMKGGGKCKNGC
jgi:hypothetical protein